MLQFFLTSVIIIKRHFLTVVFIQQLSAVKVKSSSSTVIQSKIHLIHQSQQFLFQTAKKHRVSCEVFVLSSNGRVFTSPVVEGSSVLNFSIVPELSDQEIIWLSSAHRHFLAVSKGGRVFGYRSNENGKLVLGKRNKISFVIHRNSTTFRIRNHIYKNMFFYLFSSIFF